MSAIVPFFQVFRLLIFMVFHARFKAFGLILSIIIILQERRPDAMILDKGQKIEDKRIKSRELELP